MDSNIAHSIESMCSNHRTTMCVATCWSFQTLSATFYAVFANILSVILVCSTLKYISTNVFHITSPSFTFLHLSSPSCTFIDLHPLTVIVLELPLSHNLRLLPLFLLCVVGHVALCFIQPVFPLTTRRLLLSMVLTGWYVYTYDIKMRDPKKR